jgi:DNA primase
LNIIDLLSRHGIQAKKVSSRKGGEYASACPSCGGVDRFRSWPEQNPSKDGRHSGSYWCRRCGRGGDLIQFLRDFDGLTFKEACERLGRRLADPRDLASRYPRSSHPANWKPHKYANPETRWKEKAQAFVDHCFTSLWEDEEAIIYLSGRGFRAETVEAFSLGWNKVDLYRDRESWGLSVIKNEKGRRRPLWLPAGLVIPWRINGEVKRIRIRRQDPGAIRLRYYAVPGSTMGTMLITARNHPIPGDIFVIVESELDAMLIWQEAGDLVGTVGLGSVSARPDADATKTLCSSPFILVAVDYDAAGLKEWAWWRDHFRDAHQHTTPEYKDPGDAAKAGLNLRDWVIAGLPAPLQKMLI